MVVDDFDLFRTRCFPDEANAVLVIDPDTVLTAPISSQRLQLIPGRHAQVGEFLGNVKCVQLAAGYLVQSARKYPPCRLGRAAIEDVLRSGVRK